MSSREVIDGEEFIFLTDEDLRLVCETKKYDGEIVFVSTIPSMIFERDKVGGGLRLGLHKGFPNKVWVPDYIMNYFDRSIRIQLNVEECTSCGWEGYCANTYFGDIYLGAKDFDMAFDKGKKYKNVGCPECGSKLRLGTIRTFK
ncbi:Uncharacterised protein [BD1-7 clade bacterium]|uniref:Uncharacterized protein n=1 Tax=BD1-7 clade bacterium TaxID=2029982 RepID=A0A5S9Q4D3_9GAMM|nr:Uncharacterised protein [BD1-7 clade bacterium]CAA0112027.1 Uncharacterised protein [BD1-7 clade bacterium]